MKTSLWLTVAIPAAAGVLWYLLAPLIVSIGDNRVARRNPDHYAKLVRFSRLWGCLAVAVGFGVAFLR